MNGLLKQAMSLSLVGKCVAAVVGILPHSRHFSCPRTNAATPLRPGQFSLSGPQIHRLSLVTSRFCFFSRLLFEDHLGRLSFAIGVIGAGVAVALQDVLASLAGAFTIGFSKLYMAGDRVQIGDTRGDVIDIGLLRTTLMETGNWVSKDRYNGRIVRVPNSAVLKGPIFNYSQGFPFVWDEIKVVFTTGSDFQFAKDMLTRVRQRSDWGLSAGGAGLHGRSSVTTMKP